MTFLSLNDLKREYKSLEDNIVTDFYIPILRHARIYKRAVAYFSSSALIQLTVGLSELIKNNGKVQLIISPQLTQNDIDEIDKGYTLRKKIEDQIISCIQEPRDEIEKERMSWIAYMIANNILDIKIAYINKNGPGIYHEKIGVFYDLEDNKIAFSGSLNETYSAYYNNYESFDVYRSWKPEDYNRVMDKDKSFDSLWNNIVPSITMLDFPDAAKKELLKYKKEEELNYLIDSVNESKESYLVNKKPEIPNGYLLYDYQEIAISNWKNKNYVGIFDMATGTGKTITGLSALVELIKNVKRVAVVIICPYQHLVEQWVEDIVKFNIQPIIGYSSSQQKDWKRRLKNQIIEYNLGSLDFLCFVTTIATFRSESVQNEMNRIKENKTIIVDEAHNIGALNSQQFLDESYKYRLALSATIDRYQDEVGTEVLYDFFGEKCIEYDIERAILEEKLTPYYYYPVITSLSVNEHEKYVKISKRISKMINFSTDGRISNFDQVKMLFIERSRIVAGAINKIVALKEKINPYKNDTHMLIYCGATRIYHEDITIDEFGERQIIEVSKLLGNDLDIVNTHFTSNESAIERKEIKEKFSNADPYQALIAIKCLDEGVNIPSIKTAFILASTTNPKEYIQRRGRVLRKYEGKHSAEIYDFITLPTESNQVNVTNPDEVKYDLSLIKREITRMKEFSSISLNPKDSEVIIDKLSSLYNLDLIEENDEFNGNG